MKITRRADALRELDPLDASHLTGKAGAHPLLPAAAPLPPTSAAVVWFEAGGPKPWPCHAGGPTVVVIASAGRVPARSVSAQPVEGPDVRLTGPQHRRARSA